MYFLVKCKKCDRSGQVALIENDEVCNLCKVKQEKKEEKAEKNGGDVSNFEQN